MGVGISLTPNSPQQCEMLTVGWPPTLRPVLSFGVHISDKKINQTLFSTSINGATSSVEWIVNATEKAVIHIAVHTPPGPNSDHHYVATDIQVHGPSTCVLSVSTSTQVTMMTTVYTSLAPPASASTISVPATSTRTTATMTTSDETVQHSSSHSNTYTVQSSESRMMYPGSSTTSPPDDTPSSLPSHKPSHTLSSGAIAGIVIGTFLGIVLVVLAFYLLKKRARRRAAAQRTWFPPHIGRLSHTSRSRFPARESSDSYLSEVESDKPIPAWKPELFVREKLEAGYAQPQASCSPLAQRSSRPSGTAVTVPWSEELMQA